MIRLRSRICVSQTRDHRLIVQSSITRRILFGGIALLLLVSFIVGVDWERGLDDGLVVGTVFYFAVTAICLAVAGGNAKLVLNRNQGTICVTRSLFAIVFSRRNLSFPQVRAVVLRGIRLLRESEQPRDALVSNRFQGYMERRMHYYKLHLETDDQLHLVEDSTDLEELEAAATALADVLSVPFRREEL